MCQCWECDYTTAIEDADGMFAIFKCGFKDSPMYGKPINDHISCEVGEVDGIQKNCIGVENYGLQK